MMERGYSLVELLVVLAVMTVLGSVAMPLAEVTVQREKERELKRALWEIRDALDAYRRAREQGAIAGGTDASPYPANLAALTAAYSDLRPASVGRTIRFLRRIPRDPFAPPELPDNQVWGLRSYLSDADNPQPGSDVFDVYSKSRAIGLNGTPLRQW